MNHRERLTLLRRRFIAANMRSRSLRLTRTTRSGALDLSRLAGLDPQRFEALRSVLGKDSSDAVAITPLRPQPAEEKAFSDDLGTVLQAARSDWVETGAKNLSVGWPILEGRSSDGTWLRGPLLLYPVSFETSSVGMQRWLAKVDSFPILNAGLAQAILRHTGVRITLEAILDHDDDRVLAIDGPTWRDLWRCLVSLELPMVTAEAELGALTPLPTRDRSARDNHPKGQFAFHHHIILGRFPRGGSNIIFDYDNLLEKNDLGLAAELLAVDEDAPWEAESPLEDRGEQHPIGDRSGRAWQVLPSDSSQDAVFHFLESSKNQGLVVQGPPGTGKSQMITNLIASAIATEKRVLLVCQKRAALDVVADRLESVGLRQPIAVVHDVQSDRNMVCDGIGETLDKILSGGGKSEDLDKSLSATERACDIARGSLEARLVAAQKSFELLAVGGPLPPLAQLQEWALDDDERPLPDLVGCAATVDRAQALALRPRISALSHETTSLAAPHPLSNRQTWRGLEREDLARVFEVVSAALEVVRAMAEPGPHLNLAQTQGLAQEWRAAEGLLDMIQSEDTPRIDAFLLFWFWTDGQAQHGEWARVMDILRKAQKTLKKVPHELILAKRSEVERWLENLVRLKTLSRKWYSFLLPEYWSVSKTPKTVLDRCLSLSAEQGSGLVKIDDLCQRALGWHDLIESLPSDNLALNLGFQGDPLEIGDTINDLKLQHDRVEDLHRLQEKLEGFGGPYAQLPTIDPLSDLSRLSFFKAALADRNRVKLIQRFGEILLEMAASWEENFIASLEASVREERMEDAIESLTGLMETADQAHQALGLDRQMDADPEWMARFLRQWRPPEGAVPDAAADAMLCLERAWRKIILDGRSPRLLESALIDDVQLAGFAADLDKSLEMAGLGVLARYQRRLNAAAADRTKSKALRKLAGEARKKRRRMTLRQLVEHHWDSGLAQVRPVWFCSPESVAALFPLRSDLFDVVIFDEASQCPVESAVPTLARTRRVIIAGDDQQMPPSHFFRASDMDEDGDEESAVMASHSTLALARVAFADTTLRWHYRSRHESLVAFSNEAFYGGRLITAPRRDPISSPLVEGLHFQNVKGVWSDQRNEKEAREVVSLLARLLTARTPDGTVPTVGVVTFNRKQAELIERLLTIEASEQLRQLLEIDRHRPAIEQLFVRNLENVQGDERDVIIFSTGYGPSQPGGRVHARFGPLGQQGGEKRLNVAITRAKLGVWVLSSFDPQGIDVSSTKNVGPKLFKLYLQYVKAAARQRPAQVREALEEAKKIGGGEGITGHHRAEGGSLRPGRRVRNELAAALSDKGLRVQSGLGLGSQRLDLAVGLNSTDGWTVGVDCSEFLNTSDPMARDVYTPRFWSRLGWNVLRITPSMWLHHREEVVARVLKAVKG